MKQRCTVSNEREAVGSYTKALVLEDFMEETCLEFY